MSEVAEVEPPVAVLELTILMPCLNEANTVAVCVNKARTFLAEFDVRGEVLVADNGSADGSQALAESAGARVVPIKNKGYGAALRGGIAHAQGRYIIMGDADDSYDFSALKGMLDELRNGSDLVMGNRFEGGIESNAMPFLHRYLGNPVLSFIGRLFYRNNIGDFHCGIRGFRAEAIRALRLGCDGMEFASEMVVKSALHRLRISEVPVRLYKDGRGRPPHLRTWRDGWRHLKFLLLHSPRWLFLLPGMTLLLLGLVMAVVIAFGSLQIRGIALDIHTLAYAGAAVILGFQMVVFAVLTRLIGTRNGWLPESPMLTRVVAALTLERCLIASAVLFLSGLSMSFYAVWLWAQAGYGAISPQVTMRWVIPSVTAMALGGELFLSAFFLQALHLPARLPGNALRPENMELL